MNPPTSCTFETKGTFEERSGFFWKRWIFGWIFLLFLSFFNFFFYLRRMEGFLDGMQRDLRSYFCSGDTSVTGTLPLLWIVERDFATSQWISGRARTGPKERWMQINPMQMPSLK